VCEREREREKCVLWSKITIHAYLVNFWDFIINSL